MFWGCYLFFPPRRLFSHAGPIIYLLRAAPGIASVKRMSGARFRCSFIFSSDLVTFSALCLSSPRLHQSANNGCFLYPFVWWFAYIRENQIVEWWFEYRGGKTTVVRRGEQWRGGGATNLAAGRTRPAAGENRRVGIRTPIRPTAR